MLTDNDILTITEVAEYLKITERTIYGWAQDGVIPAYKMAGSWRFRRRDIDRWLETTRTGPTLSDPRIAPEPPKSQAEEAVESKRERELLITECVGAIEADLGDRSRSAWGISRYSKFKEDILNEALRRLENRKLISTKTINGELTITRR